MDGLLSQKDLFDSDNEAKRLGKARISSSLDPVMKSHVYKYDAIVLFNHDVDVENPFSEYKLTMFTEQDINRDWILKKLGAASRITILTNLSPFPGQKMSLFGKIELGKNIVG